MAKTEETDFFTAKDAAKEAAARPKTPKELFVEKASAAMDGFELLELDANEKIEIAEKLQTKLDWIRWRAGIDKECFPCRKKNRPDAKRCVHCDAIFICEECFSRSNGTAQRCSHGAGVPRVEIPKLIKRALTPEEEEDRDKRAAKIPRFSFGSE